MFDELTKCFNDSKGINKIFLIIVGFLSLGTVHYAGFVNRLPGDFLHILPLGFYSKFLGSFIIYFLTSYILIKVLSLLLLYFYNLEFPYKYKPSYFVKSKRHGFLYWVYFIRIYHRALMMLSVGRSRLLATKYILVVFLFMNFYIGSVFSVNFWNTISPVVIFAIIMTGYHRKNKRLKNIYHNIRSKGFSFETMNILLPLVYMVFIFSAYSLGGARYKYLISCDPVYAISSDFEGYINVLIASNNLILGIDKSDDLIFINDSYFIKSNVK